MEPINNSIRVEKKYFLLKNSRLTPITQLPHAVVRELSKMNVVALMQLYH